MVETVKVNTIKAVMRKTLLAAVLAATAGRAMAADDNVDINVVGQIVLAACTASVTGGGTVDYGSIQSSPLVQGDLILLGVKNLDLNITFEAPAKIALKI